MADISKIKLPDNNTYDIKDKTSGYITGMTILTYGTSTWDDFIAAYNADKVVYCRASSNTDPSSGAKTRLAFMAYVNASPPTNVEFQYYRSIQTHSNSQQGDQVFVYKLDKTAGWSVTTREAYTKIVAGTNMSYTYGSGKLTLNVNSISAEDVVYDESEHQTQFISQGEESVGDIFEAIYYGYQEALVSGTNIKTINSTSLLGSGDISLQTPLTAGTGIDITNGVITNKFAYLTSTNLNNVNYNFQGYVGDSCTNTPTGYGGSLSVCVTGGGDYGSQLFTSYLTQPRTFVRALNNGTWGSWTELVEAYKAGDSITFDNAFTEVGYVSSSSKGIYFSIHLPKPVEASSITVNNFKCRIRAATGGYVSTDVDLVADGGTTVTALIQRGTKTIEMDLVRNGTENPTTWQVGGSTITNNSIVLIDFRSTAKITFG